MADWSDMIGLTLDEALNKVERYDHKLRVTHYNGEPVPVFRDYQGDRVNVWVGRENGGDPWRVTKLGGVN
jgi:hypothetical protein